MGQYMLLLVGRGAQPQAADAETRDYNARWMEYMGGLARSGVLRAGAPFAAAGQVVQRGTVSDVALSEVDIGGFLLIGAESAEAAARIAGEAPPIPPRGPGAGRPRRGGPPPPGRP